MMFLDGSFGTNIVSPVEKKKQKPMKEERRKISGFGHGKLVILI